MISKLKTVVAIAILAQLAWFLLPQIEYRWMTEDALTVVSYSGFESKLDLASWMSWASLAATVFVLVCLFAFGAAARYWVLVYMVVNVVVLVPLAGINVETGLSMAIRDTLNMLIGAALVLSFWGEANKEGGRPEKLD